MLDAIGDASIGARGAVGASTLRGGSHAASPMSRPTPTTAPMTQGTRDGRTRVGGGAVTSGDADAAGGWGELSGGPSGAAIFRSVSRTLPPTCVAARAA